MPKIVNHEQYRKELLGKCFDLFATKCQLLGEMITAYLQQKAEVKINN